MLIWGLAVWIVVLCGSAMVLRWSMRWGSTAEERCREMPGDDYLDSGATLRLAMTRAVSIEAPAERLRESALSGGVAWRSTMG